MQSALEKVEWPRFSGLTIGKVYRARPEANMVDIMLFDGGLLDGVQVVVSSASSKTGILNLPISVYSQDMIKRQNPLATARSNESDVFAVVGFIGGSILRPIVLGFLFPEENELLCKEDGLYLWKHSSNVYTRVSNAGDIELSHPSGFFVKVGTSKTKTKIDNYDKNIRPFNSGSGPAPYIYIEHPSKSSYAMDPSGNVKSNIAGGEETDIAGDDKLAIGGSCIITVGKASGASNSSIPEAKMPTSLLGGIAQVSLGGKTISTVVSTPEVLGDLPLASGTNFIKDHITEAQKVCILGNSVASNLVSGDVSNAVGKVVNISNTPFTIVGVLSAVGETVDGVDKDNLISVPLTSALKNLGGSTWQSASNMVGGLTNEITTPIKNTISEALGSGISDSLGGVTGGISGALGGVTGDISSKISESLGSLGSDISSKISGALGSVTGDISSKISGALSDISGSLGKSVSSQLNGLLGKEFSGALGNLDSITSGLTGSLMSGLSGQLSSALGGSLGGQVSSLLGGDLEGQISNMIGGQLGGALSAGLGSAVSGALGGAVSGVLGSVMGVIGKSLNISVSGSVTESATMMWTRKATTKIQDSSLEIHHNTGKVQSTVGELSPISPAPNQGSLYCWFKYDEGSGSVIKDYSPLAIDGALELAFGDFQPKFWSVPGFGHNDDSGVLGWVLGYSRPSRDSHYASMVGFIKPIAAPASPIGSAAMWMGVGGDQNWLKIGWDWWWMGHPGEWLISGENLEYPGVMATGVIATLNTWWFVYASCAVEGNGSGSSLTQFYAAQVGSPLTLLGSWPSGNHYHAAIGAVAAFGGNNGDYPMDGGDMLWWLSDKPDGVIGVDAATRFYYQLGPKYGMA